MATSEADVCSAALQELGAAAITSLTENTDSARLCARLYPRARRHVLAEHTWNRATRRIALAQDATPPIYGYLFSYTLPVNCLRVMHTNLDKAQGGSGTPWVVETGADGSVAILTDATGMSITYVFDQ